ncbi:MAG TPA: DUF6691 family protein [Rudaea sp.]|nr:DUF6691 family protein [Rudaea sp.]
MRSVLAALLSGALFGVGLAISRMTDPTVVLGFLDVFGRFDPTLAFVLVGAVGTTMITCPLVMRRPQPVLAADFHVPTSRNIDPALVLGAAIFGVGWGLAGYCPGPVLVGAAGGVGTALVFVPAMIAGSFIERFVSSSPGAIGRRRATTS